MLLAPNIESTGTLFTISNGVNGIFETICAMRALVKQAKIIPDVRNAAISITFLTPEKDQYSEACAIFEYVRDSIRYVQDVAGIETLAIPEKTLLTKIGDCDDQAVLCASLLESIGYFTRFVVTGYSDPSQLEHVYLQVYVNGHWVDCDCTEKQPFGYAPPDPVVIYLENV